MTVRMAPGFSQPTIYTDTVGLVIDLKRKDVLLGHTLSGIHYSSRLILYGRQENWRNL